MKLITLVATLLATCPLVFGLEAAPEGYEAEIPQWEMEISPGGETVLLNGTIEEAHEQLLKLNPNWDNEFPEDISEEDEDQSSHLVKRSDFYRAKYECGKWPKAREVPIINGIQYLRRVKGRPYAGPGPAKCGRVSCSYNSAIWWCNDSKKGKLLESFGSIADGATYVLGRCGGLSSKTVSGRAYHRTSWNVLVKKAKC